MFLSRLGANIALAIGVLVLVGYALNHETLKSVIANAVAMNPLTAICFILAGISTQTLLTGKASWRRLGAVLAVFILLIGGLKLVSSVWGVPFYLDKLLFPGQVNMPALGFVNQMAPNTALCFLFLGTSLWLFHRGGKEDAAQVLATASFFVALLALLGYIYGARNLTQVSAHIPMAMNTAIAFLFATLAAQLAVPDKGYMRLVVSGGSGGILARRLLPLTLLLPIAGGFFRVWAHHNLEISFEIGVAAYAISLIAVFSFLVWKLSWKLQAADEELVTAAEQLKQDNERMETLLASIGDGVVAIDKNWSITLWNPAASVITGWEKEDVLGKPFRQRVKFIRESDRSEYISFISEAMLSGRSRTIEDRVLLIRKDGTEIPVGDSAAPIMNGHGAEGAIIVFRDVTSERNRNMVSSDVAYASHQMRTPVTQAMWNMEEAQKKKSVKSMREHVDIAYTALKSVQKLVRDLLDVSDIDSGIVFTRPAPVKIKQLISGASKKLKQKAGDFGLKIQLSVDPSATIQADGKLFERVLFEIMENAVSYNKKRGTVRVSVSQEEAGVLISVEDTGVGIVDEQKSLVFTKFFRGQNVPVGSIGTGLGLYIARKYAELMGAKLWFTSEAGKGSTFFILLPGRLKVQGP